MNTAGLQQYLFNSPAALCNWHNLQMLLLRRVENRLDSQRRTTWLERRHGAGLR
jgi:hypothetical protein